MARYWKILSFVSLASAYLMAAPCTKMPGGFSFIPNIGSGGFDLGGLLPI
jgi:hypothetical protein